MAVAEGERGVEAGGGSGQVQGGDGDVDHVGPDAIGCIFRMVDRSQAWVRTWNRNLELFVLFRLSLWKEIYFARLYPYRIEEWKLNGSGKLKQRKHQLKIATTQVGVAM